MCMGSAVDTGVVCRLPTCIVRPLFPHYHMAELGDRTSVASPQTLSTPLPELSLKAQAELDALHHLPDDALWTIARAQMSEDMQTRAYECLSQNCING